MSRRIAPRLAGASTARLAACAQPTALWASSSRHQHKTASSSHAAAFFSARAPARGRAAAAAAAAPRRSPLLIHGAGLSPARSFSTSPAARAWSVPGLSWLGYGKSTSTGETTPTTTPSAELLDSHSGALAQAEPPSAPPAVELDSASEVLSNAATGASSSVADALYGNLDLSALSGWGLHPVMRLQSVLINMHEYLVSAALPTSIAPYGWLVAVPLFTLALRSLLVPFLVRQQQNVARMAVIQPKMLEGMTKVKDAKAKGDLMGMQTAQYEVQQLMLKHKVNPIKNVVFPIAQGGVFVCCFFALKGLADAGVPSLHTEGALWFADLAARDPYYVLPLASTAITALSVELGIDAGTQTQTTMTRNMKLFLRAALVVSLPFIAKFPAVVLVYWVVNNLVTLVQTSVMRAPGVRSALNIPAPPKRLQPGDAGYKPEPSFKEAFSTMLGDVRERSETAASERARQNKLRDAHRHYARPATVATADAAETTAHAGGGKLLKARRRNALRMQEAAARANEDK